MSLADFETQMNERLQRIEDLLERVLERNAYLEARAKSPDPEHCRIQEVRKYVDCKPQSIYNWRSEYKQKYGQEIPFIEQVGGCDRVNIIKLKQFMEDRKNKVNQKLDRVKSNLLQYRTRQARKSA